VATATGVQEVALPSLATPLLVPLLPPPLLPPPPELLELLLLPPPLQDGMHAPVMQLTMSLNAVIADDESDEVHPEKHEVDDVGQFAMQGNASRQVPSAVHASHAEAQLDVRQLSQEGSLLNTGTMHDEPPSSAAPPSAGFKSRIPSMEAQALVQRIKAAPAVSTASSPSRRLRLSPVAI
jgi:hypothetical protein